MLNYVVRDSEAVLSRWLEDREILLIRGPRQSGKTTLLERTRQLLTGKGVDESRIHYFSFEEDVARLKFEADCKEYVSFYRKPGKNYFLLDELQYVKDAGRRLKLLFDFFPDAKFIASGSSSFDLTNLGANLAGRVVFLDLFPFSFREFLRAKNPGYEKKYAELKVGMDGETLSQPTVFLDDLNRLLHEYLTYGRYPRIVLEADKEKKRELLKNLFTTYVEKDVVSLYGNKYRDPAVKLLQCLARTIGSQVNYENLARNSGLRYTEVRALLPLLEDSFVVSVVKPFFQDRVSELRKNPKVYFVDYGLRNHLLERFEASDFDALYENFVFNQLSASGPVKYWCTTAKTEVDFVLEKGNIPVEVKKTPKITRALVSFIQQYAPKKAFVANLNEVARRQIGPCPVWSVPFAYL